MVVRNKATEHASSPPCQGSDHSTLPCDRITRICPMEGFDGYMIGKIEPTRFLSQFTTIPSTFYNDQWICVV